MKELRIGIAGLGAVGSAVALALHTQEEQIAACAGCRIRLVAVSARTRGRSRGVDLTSYRWYDDPCGLATADDIDVVVELMGGAEGAARELVTKALQSGKSVVTANKALLAAHGVTLAKIVEETGKYLTFEAAVAGGVPVIKTLRESLAANRVTKIRGILNGTCNDILSRMAREGVEFDQALRAAQEAGYAEADPSQDIDGFDAMQKILLLAMMAFKTRIDPSAIACQGIRDIQLHDVVQARRDGLVIKLIATAERTVGGMNIQVKPERLRTADSFAVLNGPTNAIEIHGDMTGPLTLIGAGAGGQATASAVLADLMDVAQGRRTLPFGVPVVSLA